MVLGMSQMTGARGVSPPYGAFLEVALEDVAARECVFTKMTLIGPLAGICNQLDGILTISPTTPLTAQQMSLQML